MIDFLSWSPGFHITKNRPRSRVLLKVRFLVTVWTIELVDTFPNKGGHMASEKPAMKKDKVTRFGRAGHCSSLAHLGGEERQTLQYKK